MMNLLLTVAAFQLPYSQTLSGIMTVAVSGDGGDELFGGYPRYFWAARIQRAQKVFGISGSNIIASLLKSLPSTFLDGIDTTVFHKRFGGANGLADRVYRFADYLRCAPEDIHRNIISAWKNPAEVMGLRCSDALLVDPMRHASLGWAENMMAIDQERFLPDDVLTKMDRATMSVGLEGRAPFLDHRLVGGPGECHQIEAECSGRSWKVDIA